MVEGYTKTQATMLFDTDVNLVLCCEMQDLPLSRAAATLVAARPECARIAARLHTRIDVAWSAIAGSR